MSRAPRAGAPIGIFDSGLGGLTVARAVIDILPNESIVYFGDNGRFPYGTKPLEQVHAYATEIIDLLREHGVKLIVVGCNSASSALLRLGRPDVGLAIVTVVDGPAHTAARLTRNRRVGVIGTEATIASGQYEDALRQWSPHPVHIVTRACPEFVEFVERGDIYGSRVLDTAEEYLAPLRNAGIDTLILGCTHYPLLRGPIQHVMGPDVFLVSSAEETAKDVYTVLAAHGLQRLDPDVPARVFLTSGDEHEFLRLGQRFLGPEIAAVKRHPLDESNARRTREADFR